MDKFLPGDRVTYSFEFMKLLMRLGLRASIMSGLVVEDLGDDLIMVEQNDGERYPISKSNIVKLQSQS